MKTFLFIFFVLMGLPFLHPFQEGFQGNSVFALSPMTSLKDHNALVKDLTGLMGQIDRQTIHTLKAKKWAGEEVTGPLFMPSDSIFENLNRSFTSLKSPSVDSCMSERYSRCSSSRSVSESRLRIPTIPFMGVLISWFIFARNSVFT